MEDRYAEWLLNQCLENQEGNVKDSQCALIESDTHLAMMQKFGIGNNWAYEVIRRTVKQYPQLHLRKSEVKRADGGYELELFWLEPS